MRRQFMIFWALLKTDLSLIQARIKARIINMFIWGGSTCIVAGYILQKFGISAEFGSFQTTSVVTSATGLLIFSELFIMVADLEGDKHINYQMSLPVPNWLIFIKMAIIYAAKGFLLCVLTVPIIKIFLWSRVDLMQIKVFWFLMTLVVINIFFGFFNLLFVSYAKLQTAENLIVRILFPLWFLGGFQFSYKIAHSVSPILGYCTLLSPYTFVTEAVRATMLDSRDFMPLWISLSVLIVLTIFYGYWGIRNLKKRLDLV